MRVTGLVLAAGGSRRLGEAKQLLPFRGRTLLDATLDTARACGAVLHLGAADRLVLLLGDQPGTRPDDVRRLVLDVDTRDDYERLLALPDEAR